MNPEMNAKKKQIPISEFWDLNYDFKYKMLINGNQVNSIKNRSN